MRRFKILAFAAALLAIFSASASADIFYTVSNYANGSAGTIAIAGSEYVVSKDLVVALGGDAKAYSFKDHDGAEKILVREYVPNRPDDSVYIYAPGKSSPDINKNTFGTNIYGVAASGQYLYTVGYGGDEAASGHVIRTDMKNGYRRDKPYDLESYVVDKGRNMHRVGVSVKTHGDNVYVVTAVHDELIPLWAWYPGEVIEFDRDLKPTGRVAAIGKNAGGMTEGVSLYKGKLYIGCSGGVLGAESFGDYWEVDLAAMTSKKVIDLSDKNLGLDKAYGGYGVAITDDGVAFLTLLRYDGDAPSAKLFVTSVQEMIQGSIGREVSSFAGKTGISWGTLYDEKNSTLWCMAGTDLEARGKDGSLKKTFTPAHLGDSIYSVALIDSAWGGGSGGDSGGGGCDAGFTPLALLLAIPAFLVSRKCRKN
jgi:Synergist-CTERM protein sorting domain-containing protein